MRLLLEIVKEIRSTLGPKFLISVSFSLHYPTIDYTPISLPELLEMIELLVQTRHIDILELDIRKYPFYLTNEQFAKTFAGFSQIGSQKQVSEKFDFQFLKNVHYLCHQSSCRFMLSARDGDSGTPELYHSFFNECCDILAYSDIFYSLDWIQSCVRKDSRSTFSMNGTYSRWYLIYILGGRIHSSDNFDSYFTSIINFFFHNQYSGLLFQQAYCNLLLNQIIDPPSDTHHALYSHQLSLVGFFQLLQTVLSILCRRLGCDKYSTIVNIFFFSLLISSFLSLAFVLWVLIEVTTK